MGVTEYFGLPLLMPGAVRTATVQTGGGSLNLRGAPTTAAPVLQRIPDGAQVEVLSEYNGWYVVRYQDLIGYVQGNYLAFS